MNKFFHYYIFFIKFILNVLQIKFTELQEKVMQLKSSKVLPKNIAYLHDLNNIVSLEVPTSKKSSNITYEHLKDQLVALQQNKTKTRASQIENNFQLLKNTKILLVSHQSIIIYDEHIQHFYQTKFLKSF